MGADQIMSATGCGLFTERNVHFTMTSYLGQPGDPMMWTVRNTESGLYRLIHMQNNEMGIDEVVLPVFSTYDEANIFVGCKAEEPVLIEFKDNTEVVLLSIAN